MEQNEFNRDQPTPRPPPAHIPQQQPMQPWATPMTPPPTMPGALGAASDQQMQMQMDLHHLKLLAIFYYISAGLQVIGGCFGAFYVVLGIGVANTPPPQSGPRDPNEPPPEVIGGFLMGLGGCIGLLCIIWAVLCIMTGVSLTAQKRRMLCMITAGFMCLNIPLGTILGIFTFVVLSRPSVAALFNKTRVMTE